MAELAQIAMGDAEFEIVIRVPISALPTAAEVAFDRVLGFGNHSYRVTDKHVFAQEVVFELNRESENGGTPVHKVLDAACFAALEQGAEGVSDRAEPTAPEPAP